MATDQERLLAKIRAEPDDDAVRLVYADWLEETNDPLNMARANLIRAQCDIAKQQANVDEILSQYGRQLLAQDLGRNYEEYLWTQNGIPFFPYHRGFVTTVNFAHNQEGAAPERFFRRYNQLRDKLPLTEIGVGYFDPLEIHDFSRNSTIKNLLQDIEEGRVKTVYTNQDGALAHHLCNPWRDDDKRFTTVHSHVVHSFDQANYDNGLDEFHLLSHSPLPYVTPLSICPARNRANSASLAS